MKSNYELQNIYRHGSWTDCPYLTSYVTQTLQGLAHHVPKTTHSGRFRLILDHPFVSNFSGSIPENVKGNTSLAWALLGVGKVRQKRDQIPLAK